MPSLSCSTHIFIPRLLEKLAILFCKRLDERKMPDMSLLSHLDMWMIRSKGYLRPDTLSGRHYLTAWIERFSMRWIQEALAITKERKVLKCGAKYIPTFSQIHIPFHCQCTRSNVPILQSLQVFVQRQTVCLLSRQIAIYPRRKTARDNAFYRRAMGRAFDRWRCSFFSTSSEGSLHWEY